MLQRIRQLLSRISGVQTPLGGVSLEKNARTARSAELKAFQERFEQSNLDNFWDIMLEAEDLLESVVGSERLESYAIRSSSIILARCNTHKAKENGNEIEAASQESLGIALLNALKTRIQGIH